MKVVDSFPESKNTGRLQSQEHLLESRRLPFDRGANGQTNPSSLPRTVRGMRFGLTKTRMPDPICLMIESASDEAGNGRAISSGLVSGTRSDQEGDQE